MAHIRQSRPDSGLGLQIRVFKIFEGVPSSRGRGAERILIGPPGGGAATVRRVGHAVAPNFGATAKFGSSRQKGFLPEAGWAPERRLRASKAAVSSAKLERGVQFTC